MLCMYVVVYESPNIPAGHVVWDWRQFTLGNEEEKRVARERAIASLRNSQRDNPDRRYKLLLSKTVEVGI